MSEVNNENVHENVIAFENILESIEGEGSTGDSIIKEQYLSGDISREVYASTKTYRTFKNQTDFESELQFILKAYRKSANACKPSVFIDRIKDLESLGEINQYAVDILLTLLGEKKIPEPSKTSSTIRNSVGISSASKSTSTQSVSISSTPVDPCGRSTVRRASC
jgi:hypothetical protein